MRVFAVILLLGVLWGCGGQKHSSVPQAPGMNERRFNNLKVTAARDLKCPEAQLTHEFISDPQVKNGLHRGHVYQGGNLQEFEEKTGILGEKVLYVGDHIYGDILRAKKSSVWRTAMIVQELEQELSLSERHAARSSSTAARGRRRASSSSGLVGERSRSCW